MGNLTFRYKEEVKIFPDTHEKLKEFIITKMALQEILKGLL